MARPSIEGGFPKIANVSSIFLKGEEKKRCRETTKEMVLEAQYFPIEKNRKKI
jgi:hypothetical protein